MTIAEVHGKLSRSGANLTERMEDLLTSDVFSACKYVRPETLLLPFLRGAQSVEGTRLYKLLSERGVKTRFKFWPRLSNCEPDVVIAIESASGTLSIALIEAKYYSAKSSSALSEDELIAATAPRDQLAREYQALGEVHKLFGVSETKVSERVLVYVTAHRSMPKETIEESLAEIESMVPSEGPINLFWTTWFELYPLIRQTSSSASDWEIPILDDLQSLLERKHLIRFRGFQLEKTRLVPTNAIYQRQLADKGSGYTWPSSVPPLIARIYERGAFA
jgi:hypothetical protein